MSNTDLPTPDLRGVRKAVRSAPPPDSQLQQQQQRTPLLAPKSAGGSLAGTPLPLATAAIPYCPGTPDAKALAEQQHNLFYELLVHNVSHSDLVVAFYDPDSDQPHHVSGVAGAGDDGGGKEEDTEATFRRLCPLLGRPRFNKFNAVGQALLKALSKSVGGTLRA